MFGRYKFLVNAFMCCLHYIEEEDVCHTVPLLHTSLIEDSLFFTPNFVEYVAVGTEFLDDLDLDEGEGGDSKFCNDSIH